MIDPKRLPPRDQPGNGGTPEAEISPFVVEFYMVEAESFRGMAYRDEDGKWRNALNNEFLSGPVNLVE